MPRLTSSSASREVCTCSTGRGAQAQVAGQLVDRLAHRVFADQAYQRHAGQERHRVLPPRPHGAQPDLARDGQVERPAHQRGAGQQRVRVFVKTQREVHAACQQGLHHLVLVQRAHLDAHARVPRHVALQHQG
jgi:hypothetical protein